MEERMHELDTYIAHGWGWVPQPKIPANWREVPGPDLRVDERKTCSSCRQSKELASFSLYAKSADGRQYHCISCQRERNKARRGLPRVTPIKHGGVTGYNRGCRCVACKAAVATYWRNKRATANVRRDY
jgi:hypothetical protein